MAIIFGQSLIYWSGMLAGLFFILNFLGCRCCFKLTGNKLFGWIIKFHKPIVYLNVVFFLIHLALAVLSRNFNIWL